MAYITPTALSTGCLVTAASWNQNVVSNIVQLATSPLSFDFTNDRLGIGTNSPSVAFHIKGSGQATACPVFSSASDNDTMLLQGNVGGANSGGLLLFASVDTPFGGIKGLLTNGAGSSVGDLSVVLRSASNSACMTNVLRLTSGGQALLNTSANTGNSAGLTVQQGAVNDEVLTFKSTSVTHGMTAITETDTFGYMARITSGSGGMSLRGLNGASAVSALLLRGVTGGDDTTKSGITHGAVEILAQTKAGTGIAAVGASGAMLTLVNSTATEFIFRADGNLFCHLNACSNSFDEHDDVAMVRALEMHQGRPGLIDDAFNEWLKYSKHDLERNGIAAFNDHPGGDGRVYVSYTALSRLHSGAIWQMHKTQRQLEGRLARLERLLPPPAAPTLEAT